MPVLKAPLGLKEIFGRLRNIILLREDDSSSDAGEERQLEGRDGALKVFLEEDLGLGATNSSAQLDTQEQILVELKRIRILLSLALRMEVSAEEAWRN